MSQEKPSGIPNQTICNVISGLRANKNNEAKAGLIKEK